jgi:hypothetical protein
MTTPLRTVMRSSPVCLAYDLCESPVVGLRLSVRGRLEDTVGWFQYPRATRNDTVMNSSRGHGGNPS